MNTQVMISLADIDKPNKKGISKITLNFFYLNCIKMFFKTVQLI